MTVLGVSLCGDDSGLLELEAPLNLSSWFWSSLILASLSS